MSQPPDNLPPTGLHLKKAEALEITWSDGGTVVFPLAFLRKHCPCAGCKGERDLLGRQLLPVLKTTFEGPITALGGELVGNYAMRITFSDGHDTGIYSWRYLRELEELLPKC
jgi:DUF971 family protein